MPRLSGLAETMRVLLRESTEIASVLEALAAAGPSPKLGLPAARLATRVLRRRPRSAGSGEVGVAGAGIAHAKTVSPVADVEDFNLVVPGSDVGGGTRVRGLSRYWVKASSCACLSTSREGQRCLVKFCIVIVLRRGTRLRSVVAL